jgi:hypothetical protein
MSWIVISGGFMNEQSEKYSEPAVSPLRFEIGGSRGDTMRKLLVPVIATALALSFAVSADAAGSKQRVTADVKASCQAQAAKKFSAIHFMKRRDFTNNCMAQHARLAKPQTAVAAKPAPAKTAAKPMPSTTGQSTK